MKDRLITAAGALAALLAAYALFFQQPDEPPITRPLSSEAGRNGYLAASRWLQQQGVAVVSLRERYTRLLEPEPLAAAPDGNLLITTMPHAAPVRAAEREALTRWLAQGNTLLIMAALNDTPEWLALTDDAAFLEQLRALSGMRFYSPREVRQLGSDEVEMDSEAFVVAADTVVELEPVESHPLMEGVGHLRAYSDDASHVWSAWPAEPHGLMLSLMLEGRSGVGAAWETTRDGGRVIVVASASLLTNHRIAESDADRFLANIVRHHVAPEGHVIFDDMHQGLSVLYDPDAFFSDARLHYSLLFIVAAWLAYVLGSSNRLAPPLPGSSAPRQGDFLAASGGFMARRLSERDTGLLLMEEWFDEIRRSRGRLAGAGAAPPWNELDSMPALRPELRTEIERLYDRLRKGGGVDLVKLHNILQRARQAIG